MIPEHSTTRFRDREVGERQGGSGILRVRSGRYCKISLRSLSRECMAAALCHPHYRSIKSDITPEFSFTSPLDVG